jgi:hypothetical protein
VVLLSLLGMPIAPSRGLRRVEYACHAGVAASFALLCWVVLADRSGLRTQESPVTVAALALPFVSGASITISLLWCRRLNERGIGPGAVSAVRYLLIVAVALLAGGGRGSAGATGDLATLVLATAALIVLPLYALQVGIARTEPLTAHVIRALGPALIFGLELADGRIGYSGLVLLGIGLYSFFAIACNLARGWRAEHVAVART